MSKQKYMHDLWDALCEFGPEIRDEIINDYEDHFADGIERGKTEEQIVAELGSIDELVSELRDLRGDFENKGKSKKNDKDDFKKKTDSFNEFTKNFASAIGSMAASISNEAEKIFNSATGESANFAESVVNVSEKVVNKSYEFANDIKDSFNSYRTESDANVSPLENISKKDVKNLILELHHGNVVLRKSEDGAFHVQYKNYGSANQQLVYHFDFSQQEDTAYVSVKKVPGATNFFKALSCPRIEVTIDIPEDFNDVKLHSNAGNLTCENINVHNIDATTMAGNIDFNNINANDIVANSMAGNVTFMEEKAESINCKTNAGNAKVSGSVKKVKAISNAGNVKLCVKEVTEIITSTTAGNVDVCLPDSNGFTADTQTPAGNIKLEFKGSLVKGNRIGNYSMGDGSVHIKARSGAGNIKISDID